MNNDEAARIRRLLMDRYHWTRAQVADIPDQLLQAVLDA